MNGEKSAEDLEVFIQQVLLQTKKFFRSTSIGKCIVQFGLEVKWCQGTWLIAGRRLVVNPGLPSKSVSVCPLTHSDPHLHSLLCYKKLTLCY